MARLGILAIPLPAGVWTEIVTPGNWVSGVVLHNKGTDPIKLRSNPADAGTEDVLNPSDQESISTSTFRWEPRSAIVWAAPSAGQDAVIIMRFLNE